MQIHPTSNTKCIVVVIRVHQQSRRSSQQYNSPMSETQNMVTTEFGSHPGKSPLPNSFPRIQASSMIQKQ